MSTGPKTPEGKARTVAAMVAGRRRWVERMKAEGRKFPGGRKLGSRIACQPAPTVRTLADIKRMSPEELISEGKRAAKLLLDRLEMTGSLFS
jgi:hypothetical protein